MEAVFGNSLIDSDCRGYIFFQSEEEVMELKRPFVLIAEEDSDSRLIYEEVIAKTDFQGDYVFVGSGPELLGFLKDESKPRPCLVIMDLNLPLGNHVLEAIMEDKRIRAVPLIIITTEEEEDAARNAYATCANSYIIKPKSFQSFVDTMNQVFSYWFKTVKLASW